MNPVPMRVDPTPYVAAYVAIVFLLPFVIYGGYLLRATFYIEYHSISREQFADSRRREQILQQHPQLDQWYRKSVQWRMRVFKIWAVGFAVLAATTFLLSRLGII